MVMEMDLWVNTLVIEDNYLNFIPLTNIVKGEN